MKITAIKQQVKNPERVSIFVDNKYEFSLSLDELIKHSLKNNQELDQADVKKYKKISADGKLRARSLEWLLNRPHSEREFRDYLYKKKVEPEQINSLVIEFTDKGYLDNTKFAAWFTELQGRRGKSDRAIRSELFKKGIGRELADEALPAEAGDEEERLKAMIAKKQRLSRYKNDQEKLMRYLVGQGFGWQAVKEQLKANAEEQDT
ncbi:RecX family transcriptional regulator [Candidatus Saccharibacteria bacterium]|nr:RecX family transcriptional regulator [Candidatus Saccharibacteria bacterium]